MDSTPERSASNAIAKLLNGITSDDAQSDACGPYSEIVGEMMRALVDAGQVGARRPISVAAGPSPLELVAAQYADIGQDILGHDGL